MKEFEVTVTETLQRTVTVEADSKDDAIQMVEDMYRDSEIILDSEDYAGVEYSSNEGKEIEKENTMEVLLVKPGQYAEMTEIKAGLSSMQEVVGGDIEAAYFFSEPVALVCNEEGKFNGMKLNRAVKDENGNMLDIIAGTFFICGLGDENFTSLQPEYREKFAKMFKNPEAFLKMGKGFMAIPVEPEKPSQQKDKPTKSHGQEL